MQRRCERNRKRSKRRAIYCPIHGCYVDSVSQKYPLFANTVGQLQQRGVGRQSALILLASRTAVPIEGEWLEAFWCDHCQEAKWYHVKKRDLHSVKQQSSHIYEVRIAPSELWQQATGVINPEGNPTVGEFTRRQARMVGYKGMKDFGYV